MFEDLMSAMIKTGRLMVHFPDGRMKSFGAIPCDNPRLDVAMRLNRPATATKLIANPYLNFGEAFMSGEITVEKGSLWDLLDVLGRNLQDMPPQPVWKRGWNRFKQALETRNGLAASKRHVAHHYDLSEALYRSFLDTDRQYSCAYFSEPGMTLEEAQRAKKHHLIAKLDLKPGQKVLDIGCGWGGLAIDIAKASDAQVTGITLSKEQLEVARQRARMAGVDDRVRFELIDYRELEGHFDRIVSVGMFEHVGPGNYDGFFAKVKNLLTDDGVALIHSIGRRGTRGGSNSWIRKYIFPGGYIPSLSQVTRSTEEAELWITDIEILRLHYAETLKHWRERFLAKRDEMVKLYDERFCRMWEFYLASCEMSFRHGDMMVFQIQLSKRVDTLPVSRNYMFEREHALNNERAQRSYQYA